MLQCKQKQGKSCFMPVVNEDLSNDSLTRQMQTIASGKPTV